MKWKLPKRKKSDGTDGLESCKPEEQSPRRFRITTRIVAWIVVLLALLIAVAASVGLFGGDTDTISLPDGSAEAVQRKSEEQSFALTDADITLENVRQVIQDLRRPEAYSVAIDNTVFWDQDWSTCQVNQYVRDGICLTEYLDTTQEVERYEMIVDDVYYAWREGRKSYHTSSTGTVTADQTAMIPTYETIVDTDQSELTDAGLRTVNNIPCIYCVVEDSSSGYTITYSVSTVTGLLLQADYSRGDEIVRNVSITAVNMEIPEAELFELPDGTQILNVGNGTSADDTDDTQEDTISAEDVTANVTSNGLLD